MSAFGTIVVLLSLLLLWSVMIAWRMKALEEGEQLQQSSPKTRRQVMEQRRQLGEAAPEPRSASPGQCPACGTENDPFYTFCSNCVTPLHGGAPVSGRR